MRLNKQYCILHFIMLMALLSLSLVSSLTSNLSFVNVRENTANNISFCKKNDAGYVEFRLTQDHGSIFTTNKYSLEKMASYNNTNTFFFTSEQNDSFSIEYNESYHEIDSTPSYIGIANYLLPFLPLNLCELYGDNYMKNYDLFQPGGIGCLISESFASKISSSIGVTNEKLIGKSLRVDENDTKYTIINVVDNSCFPTNQNVGIKEDFIVTNYLNFASRLPAVCLNMFFSDNYYTNYAILKYFYNPFYTSYMKAWYLSLDIPNNEWLEDEINMFVEKGYVAKNSVIPFIFSVSALLMGIAAGVIIMKYNLYVSEEVDYFYNISFAFIYILVSLFFGYILNHTLINGIHIFSLSPYSIALFLIYMICFILPFCLLKNSYNKKIINNSRHYVQATFRIIDI